MGQSLSLSPLSLRFLSGLSLLFKLFGALLLSHSSKTVVSGLSPLLHLFGVLLLSPRSKNAGSGLSLFFKLLSALLPSRSSTGIFSWSPGLLAIFLSFYALFRISERAPTILFCFNRIHDKVFCCTDIWCRVATELVKKDETGLLPRTC